MYPDPNNECFISFPKICKTVLCFHPSLLVFTKTSCFACVRCWQNVSTLHLLCLSLSSTLSLTLYLYLSSFFCICGLAVSGESVCIACLSSHHWLSTTLRGMGQMKKKMLKISYSKIGIPINGFP